MLHVHMYKMVSVNREEKMKILYLFLSFCLNFTVYGEDISSLIHPLEKWIVTIPNEKVGNYEIIVSFFSQDFYQKDIENKKFSDFEFLDRAVIGFETVSFVNSKNIPASCHFPLLTIHSLHGVKYKDGKIRLSADNSYPAFSGAASLSNSFSDIELSHIKGDEAEMTVSSLSWLHQDQTLNAEKIGPLKAHRIK